MITLIVFGIFISGVGLVTLIRSYRKVAPGHALVINRLRDFHVTFHGGMVLPLLHTSAVMDLSVNQVVLDYRGTDGLRCSDDIRADITVSVYVGVNATETDVLEVARLVGCDRAGDPETLNALFHAKFTRALKIVVSQLEFADLFAQRDVLADTIREAIGNDLNGYYLNDVVVDYLEQTPLEFMDPENMLDARGISKIVDAVPTQLTATCDIEDTMIQSNGVKNTYEIRGI